MRLARLQCDSEAAPAGLEELAAGGQLDVLQLDYGRPASTAVEPGAPTELPEWPRSFAVALRQLSKTLFLEPQFRVIAAAGWADAYACVEEAAAALVAAGCGELPVAAVRGSNLLPILDMLVAEGVDLKNIETGARWRDLREPPLAADLHLGAGPLAAALAEQARVVVAGWYDPLAPALAAAVDQYSWPWRDYHRLAAAAVAARAAAWSDWEGAGEAPAGAALSAPWQVRYVDIAADAQATVHLSAASSPAAADRLRHWLAACDDGPAATGSAGVRLDVSNLKVTLAGPHQLALDGAAGAKADGTWLLEILYQTGFSAEALVEIEPAADPHLRKHIVKSAKKQLQPPGDSGTASVKELQPLGAAAAPGWIHLAYHSKSRKACHHFADLALKLVGAYRPWLRLATGAPTVHVNCGTWLARVPRDAVDIAVETRLAKEWA